MCLIAYVPKGKALTREVFDNANRTNPHGIGVMSSQGVEKFFGNKQLKRARQYVAGLAVQGLAHAVHWRYATHGTKGIALCHPFKLPNAEVWFMHNGVIGSTSHAATDDASDTLLYVNGLTDAPAEYPAELTYWEKAATSIGKYNKALVMYPDGKFVILNQDEGCTVEGIWYSNAYSLPLSVRPTHNSFTPSRLMPTRPITTYHPYNHQHTTGYYDTGRNATAYGAPFGAMIYWSVQKQSYGFWEGMKFHKLNITAGEVIDTTIPESSSTWQEGARTAVDLTTGEVTNDNKCPRCFRYKSNPPLHHLICWCRPEDVADFVAKQRAKWEGAHPSGPTELTAETPRKPVDDHCEHGNSSWEDCRECIAEIEQDGTNEVQRWLAHRSGYRLRSTNPDERAQELANNIIYLPRASDK